MIVALSVVVIATPPDDWMLAFFTCARTFCVISLRVTDTPREPDVDPPPNSPATARVPATARMFDVSSAETVIPPSLAVIPIRSLTPWIKASVLLTISLPDPAPAPANFPPVEGPSAAATPIVHARMSGDAVAVTTMSPALTSRVLTTEARVSAVMRFSAAAMPKPSPDPPAFGITMPMPPAKAQIFDFASPSARSSALTRRLSAPLVVVTLLTSAIVASVSIRTVLTVTEPPSAKLPAPAPARVTLPTSLARVACTSMLPARTVPRMFSSEARTEFLCCDAGLRGSPPSTL